MNEVLADLSLVRFEIEQLDLPAEEASKYLEYLALTEEMLLALLKESAG